MKIKISLHVKRNVIFLVLSVTVMIAQIVPKVLN